MFFIVVYALLFCMHMSYAMLTEEKVANLFFHAVRTDTFDQLSKKYQKTSPAVKKELFKKADENELIKSVIITCAVPDGIRDLIVKHMRGVNSPVSTVLDIVIWQARMHDLSQRFDSCVQKQHIKQCCDTLALFLRSSEHDFDHIESLLQLLENGAVEISGLSKQQMDHIILMPNKFLLLCKKMHYSVIKSKIGYALGSLFISVFGWCVSLFGLYSIGHELNDTSSRPMFNDSYHVYQCNYLARPVEQSAICLMIDEKIIVRIISMVYVLVLACCNFNNALTLWDEKQVDFDTLVEKCIKRREKVT